MRKLIERETRPNKGGSDDGLAYALSHAGSSRDYNGGNTKLLSSGDVVSWYLQ